MQDIQKDNSEANKRVIKKFIEQNRNKGIDWGTFLGGSLSACAALYFGMGAFYWWDDNKTRKTPVAQVPPTANPSGNGNEALLSELEKLRAELTGAQKDNLGLRSANSILEDQAKNLKDEVQRIAHGKKNAEASLEEAKRQAGEWRLKFGQAGQEKTSLKLEKDTLESQVNVLKGRVDSLTMELGSVRAANAKAKFKVNPEWITGQEEFERRWQSRVSPPGDTPISVLARFKSMMDIVHEVSLNGKALDAPKMAVRVRAGIESLIPTVWVGVTCKEFFKIIYDPMFRVGKPFMPQNDEAVARIIYLPESYRNLAKGGFSDDQVEAVKKIHAIFMHALAADKANVYRRESDSALDGSIGALHMRFNDAWERYIKEIIK